MAETGTLTPEQKQAVVEWINRRATLIGKCPICGERRWVVMDHFFNLPIFYGASLMLGGPQYPNVGVACDNCGNVQLLNAVRIGLFASEKPKPEPAEAGDGT